MKHHRTTIHDVYAEHRARQLQHEQARDIDWGLVLLYVIGALLIGLFYSWAMFTPLEEDFTDTGVGCVDDCLEPAPVVQPTTWEA